VCALVGFCGSGLQDTQGRTAAFGALAPLLMEWHVAALDARASLLMEWRVSPTSAARLLLGYLMASATLLRHKL
jgi:hypothetical protein